MRSYLYVEDVAEAFEAILRKGAIGEIYNIGTQKERTVMAVAKDIATHFNLPMDSIVHVRDRAFNDQRWVKSANEVRALASTVHIVHMLQCHMPGFDMYKSQHCPGLPKYRSCLLLIES